tara:strand:+ start:350 stop:784 length:435 start_codon:yes stop_codon:yes gene_type:complete
MIHDGKFLGGKVLKGLTWKPRKVRGKTVVSPPEKDPVTGQYRYNAIVGKDKIRLWGYKDDQQFIRDFEVGDQAEYDSYNLHYIGTIVKITTKCVTIGFLDHTRGRYGSVFTKTKRLDLYSFAWRNYDFDAAKIAAKNHETSMCI